MELEEKQEKEQPGSQYNIVLAELNFLNNALGDANREFNTIVKGSENREIVVDADLRQGSNGQLSAVGIIPDLSLGSKIGAFNQTFSSNEETFGLTNSFSGFESGTQNPNTDDSDQGALINKWVPALSYSPVELWGTLALAGLNAIDSLNSFNIKVKGPSKANYSSSGRPSWRQSEKDVSAANPDYKTQKSFKNGEEVPYGTKGSVRPDNYKEGASIEVKNYDVTTASGRNRLVDNITKQVEQRIEHLPADTSQKIVVDVRGQNVSNDVLREIRDSIVSKIGENVEIQFLR